MMHDNDFCRGCHIFVPSGQAFVKPDTGTYLLVNKVEGAHDSLSCHACHPFELKAQTKELFYWITDRPEEVPPHAKVPRKTCEQCHVTGEAKKTWQRVASTAGHRIHLESDSSALKDVACLTCHARTRAPLPAGRHHLRPEGLPPDRRGEDPAGPDGGPLHARNQPLPNEEELYCNSCHQFTAEAQFVTLDSASGTLRPASANASAVTRCGSCWPASIPAKDPHGGSCGMCHNPHTDVKPTDASKSCTDAKCHADWRGVPSTSARRTGRWRSAAAPATSRTPPGWTRATAPAATPRCARAAARSSRRSRSIPPRRCSRRMPVWSSRAASRGHGRSAPPARRPSRGDGAAPPASPPTPSPTNPSPTRLHHLPHDHVADGDLTFEPPRGCQICHHQRPAKADCAACHQRRGALAPRPVTVAVSRAAASPSLAGGRLRPRGASRVACVKCHTAR